MKFVQLIEFKTGDIEAFNRAVDEWRVKSAEFRTAGKAVQTRDRDNDRTYIQIVEFPSYEAAMENSNRPETGEFAAWRRSGALRRASHVSQPRCGVGRRALGFAAFVLRNRTRTKREPIDGQLPFTSTRET